MKKFLTVLILLALLLPLVSCGGTESAITTAPETTVTETTEPVVEFTTAATEGQTEPEPETFACSVRLTALGKSVSLLNDAQKAYLADGVFSVANYANGGQELSRPVPVVLHWDVDFDSGENDLWYFIVRIWTKTDRSDARSFLLGRSEREYSFYNALAGQKYFWNVTAYGIDGVSAASANSFFITDATEPRNIYVDGVTNVRDLGGRKTEDGGTIRQGLLYRGAKLDVGETLLITDEGIRTMRQTLGIRSEIDLRTENENKGRTASVLGDDVNYYLRTLSGSFKIPNDTMNASLRKVFAVLADENNYPIYFHCSAGADRTGLVAWFVNGLCGVPEEDLWRDYLLTNFADVGDPRTKSNIQNGYVTPLEDTAGNTFAQKVYNYLKNTAGVPATQLDAVIRILKAAPNTTGENYIYAPAEHTHKAERSFTVVELPSGSYPGVKAKRCSICGEFIEGTISGYTVVTGDAGAQ